MERHDRMMNDFDRGVILVFKAMAIIFLCFVLWALVCWLRPDPPPRPLVIQLTAEEKCWIRERFRLHGISTSIHEKGEWYFIRDGKRCRL